MSVCKQFHIWINKKRIFWQEHLMHKYSYTRAEVGNIQTIALLKAEVKKYRMGLNINSREDLNKINDHVRFIKFNLSTIFGGFDKDDSVDLDGYDKKIEELAIKKSLILMDMIKK